MTWRITAIIAALAILTACSEPPPAKPPADAAQNAPAPRPPGQMLMNNVILITDSGSADWLGYRIKIAANRDTSFVSGDGQGKATLPADLYAKLKADVDAASPLSELPHTGACDRKPEDGEITIALGGERSPDIACPESDLEQKLLRDVGDVTMFLKIRKVRRGEDQELPPLNE